MTAWVSAPEPTTATARPEQLTYRGCCWLSVRTAAPAGPHGGWLPAASPAQAVADFVHTANPNVDPADQPTHPAGAQQVMSSIESAPATIPATRAATLMPR
jgi:hypothetical protein